MICTYHGRSVFTSLCLNEAFYAWQLSHCSLHGLDVVGADARGCRWCKMSVLELGTRIPFLIRAPWIPTARGVVTHALAEAVDLYPTCVPRA